MPKNVLFLLKNCKNRQTLGALPLDTLASGPHQSSYIEQFFGIN